jgi:serine/threonine-protein kinase PknG
MSADSHGTIPVRCVRPDCQGGGNGTIQPDGYCDECGREPMAGRPAAAAVGPAPVAVITGGRCPRSGCPGTIDDEGYCDVCHRQAPAAGGPAFPTGFGPAVTPAWYTATARGLDGTGLDEFPPLTFPPGIKPRPLIRDPLGLGIVSIPPVPARDPDSLLLDNDRVMLEEARRRCPECRAEVGRSRDGVPGSPEGECPACGARYSFLPPLRPGDALGQYRVSGCVGYGGQGWVYLARDQNLDGDPVALKGQRGDAIEASQGSAADERRRLIELRHPDIVDIRNFVKHEVKRGHLANDRANGYIVLEFLAGESLAEKIRKGRLGPAEAISYILAVLPALGYLHGVGLVYGDFKPANVMQVADRIKLIDLGAVRGIGDTGRKGSWGTAGFRAPDGPSFRSDLYTVGRTLAVLTAPVEFTEEWKTGLPGPDKIAVFSEYESFYRFLCRATAADPGRRFGSAREMAGQLVGVLREVVAQDHGDSRGHGRALPPLPSVLFTPERDVVVTVDARPSARQAALALPVPKPDDTDLGTAFLSTVTAVDPDEIMAQLRQAPLGSIEVAFRRMLARMSRPGLGRAADELATLRGSGQNDWRLVWYQGLLSLAEGQGAEAWRAFAAIRDLLPGEPAPKLALAMCAEQLGQPELARHYYQTVWRTGREFVGAAFGAARTYVEEPGGAGLDDAIDMLESISPSLHHHVAARIKALQLRLSRQDLDEKDLREAAQRLTELGLDQEQGARLRIAIWQAALAWLAAGGKPGQPDLLLDVQLAPDEIGFAIERSYLGLRRFVSGRERVDLVKRAHAARPRTWWRHSRKARKRQ